MLWGGRDSSVGIATSYGWTIGGSNTSPGAHPASCTMGTGSFPEVKWPGRGADPHPNFSAKVLNWVELYLYLP